MQASSREDPREIAGYIKPSIPPPRVLRVGAFQDQLTRSLAARVAEVRGRLVVVDLMPGAGTLLTGALASMLARVAPRATAALRSLLAADVERPHPFPERPSRMEMIVYRARASDPQLLSCIDPELSDFDVVVIDHEGDGGPTSLALSRWTDRMRSGGVLLVRGARTALALDALDEWARDARLEVTWPSGSDLCVVRLGPRIARRGYAHVGEA